MNPIYLNPPPSPIPFVESNINEDLQSQASSSSSSTLSFRIFSNPTQDHQGGSFDSDPNTQKYQHEVDKYISHGGLPSDHRFLPTPSLPNMESDEHNILKLTISKQEDRDENGSDYNGRFKWMSSKMRLTRKMMNSSENINSSSSCSNTIRVCTDCNTTKTPLWRGGPRGPKSLCNACGIRQRKARRAMAMAAAGVSVLTTTNKSSIRSKVHANKEKKSSDKNYVQHHKKRGRKKKYCLEDFTISLSKNSAFHRPFPQDEKEAAIVLMALSCGLVHG